MKTLLLFMVFGAMGVWVVGAAENPIAVIHTDIQCVDISLTVEGGVSPMLGLDGTFIIAYYAPDPSTVYVEQNWYDNTDQWMGGVMYWPEEVVGSGQYETFAYGGGPVPLQFPFSVVYQVDLYTLYEGEEPNYAFHSTRFIVTCLGYGPAQITFPSVDEPTTFFNPHDGRIHPDAAAPFAAYCTEWGLHVYEVNADGQGWLAFAVDWDAIGGEAPAENTLIAETENIRLYRLTSGELQLNAGPDAEGKVYVLTWNGCPVEYSSAGTLDPFSGETIPIDARKY